jgi:hypothetical protein
MKMPNKISLGRTGARWRDQVKEDILSRARVDTDIREVLMRGQRT